MGADARIHIWNEAKLREAWPSCDELFKAMNHACFPLRLHRYTHELDGQKYVHVYQTQDDEWTRIGQDDEWNVRTPMTEAQLVAFLRLREFVRWLVVNATVWEVWT